MKKATSTTATVGETAAALVEACTRLHQPEEPRYDTVRLLLGWLLSDATYGCVSVIDDLNLKEVARDLALFVRVKTHGSVLLNAGVPLMRSLDRARNKVKLNALHAAVRINALAIGLTRESSRMTSFEIATQLTNIIDTLCAAHALRKGVRSFSRDAEFARVLTAKFEKFLLPMSLHDEAEDLIAIQGLAAA
jgi:hypothetical protein